ncbi:MAG: hypothetical protein ACKOQ3_06535 [Novosphingobium sp.]
MSGVANGELIKVKRRCREFGAVHTYQADEALAAALPDLALPRMNAAARAVFREILDYEKPPANGSVSRVLALAEARGFSADPRDWVPDFDLPGQHLPLYQPWVDALSENGFTPFTEANTLSAQNWDRWKPKPLGIALHRASRNRDWMTNLVLNHSAAMSAAHRELVLAALCAGSVERTIHAWQVPLIERFLADRSAKIQQLAQDMLQYKDVEQARRDHAHALAQHLAVVNGRVSYAVKPEPHTSPFMRHWSGTTFALLAEALGLTPPQLAHGAELDFLDSSFMILATGTGDVEVRTILARRLLAATGGENIALPLFRDLEPGLRERALESYFQSNYINSVQEFLGTEAGQLTPAQMHRMSAFQTIQEWLARHLKDGTKPVNLSYDPLRAVALSVGKDAAQEALDFALAAGMKPDNPRLTMLRFNLAL